MLTGKLLLALSSLLQLLAAVTALRLIRSTSRRLGWGLLAAGLFLMVARRLPSLAGGQSLLASEPLLYESIGLAISACILTGLVLVRGFFEEFRLMVARLKASEERYRLLFEKNLAGSIRLSVDGRLLDCNEAYLRLARCGSKAEALGRADATPWPDAAAWDPVRAALETSGTAAGVEGMLRRREAAGLPVRASLALLPADERFPAHVDGTVTAAAGSGEEGPGSALLDGVTGLPNRFHLLSRLQGLLDKASASGADPGLLAVSLVPAATGASETEPFLRAAGKHLASAVQGGGCTVAWAGGSEFTVLVPSTTGEELQWTAARVVDAFRNPVEAGGGAAVPLAASLGLALAPGDGRTAEALLAAARGALNRAAALGPGSAVLAGEVEAPAGAEPRAEKGAPR